MKKILLSFDFGVTLFLFGLLITATGLYLSDPKRYDQEIFYSGILELILSLPFICQIMYG